MKILRLHRGFTTNSSSASEYLDPSKPPPIVALDIYDEQGNLREDPATNAAPGQASTNVPSAPTAPPAKDNVLADNATMLLILVGTVLGLFALERLVRRQWRRRNTEED